MDDIDKMQDAQEVIHQANLQKSKKVVGEVLATGQCLFCDAELPPGIRWCGKECRDDWQKLEDRYE